MLHQQTYVVTGANTGIGFEIARALLQMQRHVVIVSRDVGKGQRALEALRNITQQDISYKKRPNLSKQRVMTCSPDSSGN